MSKKSILRSASEHAQEAVRLISRLNHDSRQGEEFRADDVHRVSVIASQLREASSDMYQLLGKLRPE